MGGLKNEEVVVGWGGRSNIIIGHLVVSSVQCPVCCCCCPPTTNSLIVR
jgi:hypothetical protein